MESELFEKKCELLMNGEPLYELFKSKDGLPYLTTYQQTMLQLIVDKMCLKRVEEVLKAKVKLDDFINSLVAK